MPPVQRLVNPAGRGSVPGNPGSSTAHQSNLCFKAAAGVAYHWHSYVVGTHAWVYGDRSLEDHLPRLMTFSRTGH